MTDPRQHDAYADKGKMTCSAHGVHVHDCFPLHHATVVTERREVDGIRLPCGHLMETPKGMSAKVTCDHCGRKWKLKHEHGIGWDAQEDT